MEDFSHPFPTRCAARFRPERALASGGYGSVWLAWERTLERPVVVKFLERARAEHAEQRRFTAEAKVTALLDHPGIVVVLDHDIEEERPWIAYEYVPGEDLATRLRREGRLSPAEACAIAQQVAEALSVAHARGVIHRDLKPANILDAGGGRWMLADFGIAKWAGSEVRTEAGLVLGTPVYMAPERLRGEESTPAVDLYALGILLFEMISGAPPFSGSISAIVRGHLEGTAASLRDRVPEVPPTLSRLVAELLARDASDRPGSAREVQDRLASIRPPDASTSATTPLRPARPTVRQTPRTGLGHVAAGVILVTLAGAVTFALRYDFPRPVAVDVPSSSSAMAIDDTHLREGRLLLGELRRATEENRARLRQSAVDWVLSLDSVPPATEPHETLVTEARLGLETLGRFLKDGTRLTENLMEPVTDGEVRRHLDRTMGVARRLGLEPHWLDEIVLLGSDILQTLLAHWAREIDAGGRIRSRIEQWEVEEPRSFLPPCLLSAFRRHAGDAVGERQLLEESERRLLAAFWPAGRPLDERTHRAWWFVKAHILEWYVGKDDFEGMVSTLRDYHRRVSDGVISKEFVKFEHDRRAFVELYDKKLPAARRGEWKTPK